MRTSSNGAPAARALGPELPVIDGHHGEIAFKLRDRLEVVVSAAFIARRQLRYAAGGPFDKPEWRYGTSVLPFYTLMATVGARVYL